MADGIKFISKFEASDDSTQYVRFTGMTTTGYSMLRIFITGIGVYNSDGASRLRMGINNDYVNQSGGVRWYMGKDAGGYHYNNYGTNEFEHMFPSTGAGWTYDQGANNCYGCWQIDLTLPTGDAHGAGGSGNTWPQVAGIGGYSTTQNHGSGMGSISGRIHQMGYRWNSSGYPSPADVTKLTFDIDNATWKQGSTIHIYGMEF